MKKYLKMSSAAVVIGALRLTNKCFVWEDPAIFAQKYQELLPLAKAPLILFFFGGGGTNY